MQQHGVTPRFSTQEADPGLTFQPQLNQTHQTSDTRQRLGNSLLHTELLHRNHKRVQTERLRSPDLRTQCSEISVIYYYLIFLHIEWLAEKEAKALSLITAGKD